MIKVISIAGARPQFIKTGIMSIAMSRYTQIRHLVVHTGQHFDADMSDSFFHDLQIPSPAYNLHINRLSHGAMTGRMLEKTEELFRTENPSIVIVYGDTNSTLAGALAARKLHIPVAHVEAGLRSFDMNMPEEVNRILTDRISDLLFCPTPRAVGNLEAEGYSSFACEVHLSGDIMLDAAMHFAGNLHTQPPLPKPFVLATLHREETLQSSAKLKQLITSLNQLHQHTSVLFPAHPRTLATLSELGIRTDFNLVPPFGYPQMLHALQQCSCVVTDSGGLQKEAYFFSKPCITARDSTEWTELVDAGANVLWKQNGPGLLDLYTTLLQSSPDFGKQLYGAGKSCETIIDKILLFMERHNR